MYSFLLIDPNTSYTQHLAGEIRQRGGKAWIAATPPAGLAQALTLRPDIILLDQFFPEQRGLDLLRQLRRQSLTQQTPVIMTANRPSSPVKVRAFWEGAQDYMVKPVDLRELWHVAGQLINRDLRDMPDSGAL